MQKVAGHVTTFCPLEGHPRGNFPKFSGDSSPCLPSESASGLSISRPLMQSDLWVNPWEVVQCLVNIILQHTLTSEAVILAAVSNRCAEEAKVKNEYSFNQ